jgi:hypothetical protein
MSAKHHISGAQVTQIDEKFSKIPCLAYLSGISQAERRVRGRTTVRITVRGTCVFTIDYANLGKTANGMISSPKYPHLLFQ